MVIYFYWNLSVNRLKTRRKPTKSLKLIENASTPHFFYRSSALPGSHLCDREHSQGSHWSRSTRQKPQQLAVATQADIDDGQKRCARSLGLGNKKKIKILADGAFFLPSHLSSTKYSHQKANNSTHNPEPIGNLPRPALGEATAVTGPDPRGAKYLEGVKKLR